MAYILLARCAVTQRLRVHGNDTLNWLYHSNVEVNVHRNKPLFAAVLVTILVAIAPGLALAQSKPNILLIVSDDHGYGDIGVYGGGEGRGMPRPISTRWPMRG
jgi:hypothetical protein